MHPFWMFFGGKWRLAPKYPKPIYPCIVEPFAGAAGYSVRHYERKIILVERDPIIVAVWRWLRDAKSEDVLALPDVKAGQTVDSFDLPQPARWFMGFWMNKGVERPMKSPCSWQRDGWRPKSSWGPEVRARIASQLGLIRDWAINDGDYTVAPDIEATWFIDPPYDNKAGKRYRFHDIDYAGLAAWCKSRRGQVIVCENEGATWLPFRPLCSAKTARANRSAEVIWTNDGASL